MSGDIVQRDTFEQAPQTATVTTAQTVMLTAVNLLRHNNKTFQVKNTGAAALTACKVQATAIEGSPGVPSTDDTDWEDINTTAIGALAAGATKSAQITGDSRKWWRVVGTCGTSTTTSTRCTAGGVG